MGSISKLRKIENYYKIYEVLYENPTAALHYIAQNAGISRNTASKYLKEMYENHIISGPYLTLNPHSNYKRYLYLIEFSNPFGLADILGGFPHVLYTCLTAGNWNIMVITDRQLNLSQLEGFYKMSFQGEIGFSYTLKVDHTTWDEAFKKCYQVIEQFEPVTNVRKERVLPVLSWGKNQWKLYNTFKHDMRKSITPTLKKINVGYETYTAWVRNLFIHCSVLTAFYPKGHKKYMMYSFLLSTKYKESVTSLFSFFPTTPMIIEVGNQLLVVINMISSEYQRELFSLMYFMQEKEIIQKFMYAAMLFHFEPDREEGV